jgi:hypothetical protein
MVRLDLSGLVISPTQRLYLTTHNTHKIKISMPTARFEPAISASERSHTHILDCAATAINRWSVFSIPLSKNINRL